MILELIVILGICDFLLTTLWIRRWQNNYSLLKFKHRVPIKWIEANPIIRKTIKDFGIFLGMIMGFSIVFLIQFGLYKIHYILGIIVITVLLWTNARHIANNMNTSKEHIIKVTKAWNEKVEENK